MAEILMDDVTKVYGDGTRAVSDLNLDVRDGEFIVLVGPSGCGKTTALRILCGLLTPDSGRVEIAGHGLQEQPIEARRVVRGVDGGTHNSAPACRSAIGSRNEHEPMVVRLSRAAFT